MTKLSILSTQQDNFQLCYSSVVIVLINLFIPVFLWSAEPSASSEQQLQQVNTAIEKIEQWINTAKNNRSNLQSQLQEVDTKIGDTSNSIRENRREIISQEKKLQQLVQESQLLEDRIGAQQDLIADTVRLSYMTGRQSYFKLLLNQDDPALASRMLRYYDYFNKARLAQIAKFNDSLSQLQLAKKSTDTTKKLLETTSTNLQQELLSLDESKITRAKILSNLNNSISEKNSELETLAQDRQHLQELLEEINTAVAELPRPSDQLPFTQLKGRLLWPGDGTLIAEFGSSYSAGNLKRQGILIETVEGSSVLAIHGGRVVFADWLRGSGLLIILDHGDGYMSVYAHNQTLLRGSGDWINSGEVIAASGNSGGQGASGIYFEIRHNGVAINPVHWFVNRD